jgi:Nuclease-related domain
MVESALAAQGERQDQSAPQCVPTWVMEMGAKTGNSAGKHAYSRALELSGRLAAVGCGGLLVICVAWFGFGGRGWGLILIELVAISAMWMAHRHYSPQIDAWFQGARGEKRIGRILDGLSKDGWHTLHDISLGRGNVDHVVVGPGGIFTIETKSRLRPIRVEHIHQDMLKQAYAESKLLERITGYKVEPLLVFSDAWLIGPGMARRNGVVILSARMLESFFERQSPVVTVERASSVHRHLAVALSNR